jgi:hypothetical protein
MDSVAIVSITPPVTTTLAAGTPVTFRATLTSNLASAQSGSVVMVIQDQANRNLSSTSPQPSVNVPHGAAGIELSDQIVVPAAGVTTVVVLFPLVATGGTTSLVVQSVSYTVR